MSNKELLGYTYIDIQKFKDEYEQGDYESALSTIMDNISDKIINPSEIF